MAFLNCNMLKNAICNLNRNSRSIFTANKWLAKTKIDEKNQEVELVEFEVDPEEKAAEEARINQIRNKSRLLNQDRNMLHETTPYSEPQSWIHKSVKYQRMQYGKYGAASGVDPRICFPSKSEIAERTEYDKVAYPFSLNEMIKINEDTKNQKLNAILKREDDISKNLEKLQQWKNDLEKKVAKKELDARTAKEKKDRLVEEVRRHFGFIVDTKDDKFKELLEQKEKEDKKKTKEEKRKVKEAKMLAKLVEPSEAETMKDK